MIQSKADYVFYLAADHKANRRESYSITHKILRLLLSPVLCPDRKWQFILLLRKVEYYKNCKKSLLSKLYLRLLMRKLINLQIMLGFEIHPNCIGAGLYLPHVGPIVINEKCIIGDNFTVNICTVIGSNKMNKTPVIGNNVIVEPGSKIFGGIVIANDIVIGANSVVNKSFCDENITIAGVPARKIKDWGSKPV